MVERAFQISPEELPEKEVWFAMGYKDSVPEERIRGMVRELICELVPKATLRYIYQVVEAEKLSPRQVRMAGKTFTPEGIICSYLQGMTHASIHRIGRMGVRQGERSPQSQRRHRGRFHRRLHRFGPGRNDRGQD